MKPNRYIWYPEPTFLGAKAEETQCIREEGEQKIKIRFEEISKSQKGLQAAILTMQQQLQNMANDMEMMSKSMFGESSKENMKKAFTYHVGRLDIGSSLQTKSFLGTNPIPKPEFSILDSESTREGDTPAHNKTMVLLNDLNEVISNQVVEEIEVPYVFEKMPTRITNEIHLSHEVSIEKFGTLSEIEVEHKVFAEMVGKGKESAIMVFDQMPEPKSRLNKRQNGTMVFDEMQETNFPEPNNTTMKELENWGEKLNSFLMNNFSHCSRDAIGNDITFAMVRKDKKENETIEKKKEQSYNVNGDAYLSYECRWGTTTFVIDPGGHRIYKMTMEITHSSDAKVQTEVKEFIAHTTAVNYLSFDIEGEYIGSCSDDDDGTVVISSPFTDEKMNFEYHRPMKTIALDPDYVREKYTSIKMFDKMRVTKFHKPNKSRMRELGKMEKIEQNKEQSYNLKGDVYLFYECRWKIAAFVIDPGGHRVCNYGSWLFGPCCFENKIEHLLYNWSFSYLRGVKLLSLAHTCGTMLAGTVESSFSTEGVESLKWKELDLITLVPLKIDEPYIGGSPDNEKIACINLIIAILRGNEKVGCDIEQLAQLSLKFVYLAIGAGIASLLHMTCWMVTGERQATRIRGLYLRTILRQDIEFFDTQTTTWEVIGRMSGDTILIQEAMGEKVGKFIQFMSTFFGGFIIAFCRGCLLALVLCSSIPALVVAGGCLALVMSQMSSRGQVAYAEAGNVVEQTVGAIRTVASYTGEQLATEKYDSKLQIAYASSVTQGLASGFGIGAVLFIIFSSYGLAIWYGARLIIEKGYNGGIVINVIMSIMTRGMSLGQTSPCLNAFVAAAYKMFETIERKPKIDASDNSGIVLEDIKGEIELKDVHFRYPARPEVQIFAGFSLHVPSGKTAALVGQSGSGKSTVINLVERFYDPDVGEVLIDGVNLKNLRIKGIREKMGLVSQEPILFGTSIKENILYGKENATNEEIRRAIELANAAKFIDKHMVSRNNAAIPRIVGHWAYSGSFQVTWENYLCMHNKFLEFDPWGQGSEKQGSNVMIVIIGANLNIDHRMKTIYDLIVAAQTKKRIENGIVSTVCWQLIKGTRGAIGVDENEDVESKARTVRVALRIAGTCYQLCFFFIFNAF